MQSTAEVLRSEAAWLRSIGERLESIANEIEGKVPQAAVEAMTDKPKIAISNARQLPPAGGPNEKSSDLPAAPIEKPPAAGLRHEIQKFEPMEFGGLSQEEAVLKALRIYGPQLAADLCNRVNAGGVRRPFPSVRVMSACVAKLLRKKLIQRTPENRIQSVDEEKGDGK